MMTRHFNGRAIAWPKILVFAVTALLPLSATPVAAQMPGQGGTATLEITAAAEPRPALDYTFWPPSDRRRSENAMALYSRAMISMVQTRHRSDRDADFDDKRGGWLEGPLEADEVAEVKEYLSTYQIALGELDRAIPLMGVDYPLATEDMSIAQWVSLTLEDVQIAREMARLVSLKAKVAAAEGRWDDFTHEVMTLYRLADLVGGSSDLLVTKLISFAILGIADQQVREASSQDGAPNFYWALASVPEALFDVRAALENESLLIRRVLPFDVQLPETPIGRVRATTLWQQIVDELGGTLKIVSPAQISDPASIDLLNGVGVLVLTEPSRRYLRENTDWGDRVAELSSIEAVLRATVHQLDDQTGEYLKWALLPNSIRERYLDRSEKFLDEQGSSPEKMLSPVSILTGLLLPAVKAANIASLRTRRTHFETATLQAIRDHVARTNELPETLAQMDLPPWPDPTLSDGDSPGYGYIRENASTARFNRKSRWPGDQSATLIIKLVK